MPSLPRRPWRALLHLGLLALLLGAPAAAAAEGAASLADTAPPRALREDPPLPGLDASGWPGLAPATAVADGPLVLDEAAVLDLALGRNGELAALSADLEAARQRRRLAGRLPAPELEATLLAGHEGEVELELGLDLSDLVLAPARARVARAAEAAVAAEVHGARAGLLHEVREALLAAQAAEERLAIGQRALDAQAAARDAALALRAAGSVPDLASLPHEAAYEQARLGVAQLEQERAASRERLNGLLGLHGSEADAWVPADLPSLPAALTLPAALEAEVRAASGELAALGHAALAARREASLLRAGRWLPEIEATALAVGEGMGLSDLVEHPTALSPGVGLSLSLPGFEGQGAAARAAGAEADALRLRLDARQSTLEAQVRGARVAALAAHARALHHREVVLPLRRRISDETLLHYNAMQLSVFELLAARRALLDAELEQVELTRAAHAAVLALEAALQGAPLAPAAGAARTSTLSTPDTDTGGH